MLGLGKLFGSGIGEAVQGIGDVIDQFVENYKHYVLNIKKESS